MTTPSVARFAAVRVQLWSGLAAPACLGQAIVSDLQQAAVWAKVTARGWTSSDRLQGALWVVAENGTNTTRIRAGSWVPAGDGRHVAVFGEGGDLSAWAAAPETASCG